MESLSLIAGGLAARRLSDEAVATRAVAGDRAAFGELYRRYRKRIASFCASRLGDPQRAEDAAQETFVRVLRAAPQPIRNAQGWLFTIAGNVCKDVQRGASNAEMPVEDTGLGADLPTPDSATELMRRETARIVFLALRRLPTRSRTALMLREFHGMSTAEIAESMGISKSAVDPLVSRSRDAFGVAYAEVGHFPSRCRENVERIYRDLGTGLEPGDRAELRAHLEACPRCKAEHNRAHSPRYQHALLPFLVPGVAKLGILGRAMQVAANSPGVLHGVPLGGIATATVLGVALMAPVATDYQISHRVARAVRSTSSLQSVSAGGLDMQRRTAGLGSAADVAAAVGRHDRSVGSHDAEELHHAAQRVCDTGATSQHHAVTHAEASHDTAGHLSAAHSGPQHTTSSGSGEPVSPMGTHSDTGDSAHHTTDSRIDGSAH